MTAKKTKAIAKPPALTDKEKTENIARVTLMPSANAAAIVAEYGKAFGTQDVQALIDQLRTHFAEVKGGDLHHCEAMLVGQAHALQSIFLNLSRRAINQDGLAQFEAFLRIALKAQNQCRATLETLAAIKNPPVVFAKQANISNGPQQVNNGVANSTRTEKNINQQNELLEVQHGSKTMDTRTASATSGNDPAMATMGEIHRS